MLPARIGLISDTHGLLRPEALKALRGSELLIHAGDIGKPEVLEQLKTIAPVAAVRGNVDSGPWASSLPESVVVEAAGARIYVLHDMHQLSINPLAEGFQIVVSGHSHKPGQQEIRGVLFINPGSAGRQRFKLPITVARLDLRCSPWSVEFTCLTTGQPLLR